MNFDPHTLNQIVQKIEQQMRCPQCGEKVPVDLAAVRITGDDFLLLQIKCRTCSAYIVLHASLQGIKAFQAKGEEEAQQILNASSSLTDSVHELKALELDLQRAGGSFKRLFSKGDAQSPKDAGGVAE